MDQAQLQTLVAEAMKRTALVWVSFLGSDRAWPVWHVWHEGSAYVVCGGPEQPLPGIENVGRVEVTARAKDSRERIVTWVADVAVERPRTQSWREAAELLKAERLNATQGDALLEVWAVESTVLRLTPTGDVTEFPGTYPADSLAAAPADSPATTSGKLPWVVHRRATQAPRL
ncbi:MAG TPA: hypothetical protein VHI11_02830 [Jiangellaceae bacterium]|nr:hypothetical protein [Jiangellaceae bacterium]